jgi:hypothetical protein
MAGGVGALQSQSARGAGGVEQQPGVDSTSSERYDDLLNMLDKRSQNDRLGLNYQTYIIEHRKLPVSTKTLPLVIKNLKKWVAEQMLHR